MPRRPIAGLLAANRRQQFRNVQPRRAQIARQGYAGGVYRPRLLGGPLDDALADTPVVVVAGPRQAGKSTLAAHVVAARAGTWLSLDDAATLDAALTDPVGFVSGRSGLVGIDEAQRAPELLLAIKSEVDRGRRPGRFLLTGSTRLLGAPAWPTRWRDGCRRSRYGRSPKPSWARIRGRAVSLIGRSAATSAGSIPTR